MFGLAGSVLASWEQTPPLPVALNNVMIADVAVIMAVVHQGCSLSPALSHHLHWV